MSADRRLTLSRRAAMLGLILAHQGMAFGPVRAAARSPQKNGGAEFETNDHDAAWLSLPPTPPLPEPKISGLASINGVKNFYAQFGNGPPVILLHGGLANSNYWSHQIKDLAAHFTVTVMDTRGHGRSPLSSTNFSYPEFADDVADLLKFLAIEKAAIVGWSDGAITGLQLAMTRPGMVTKLFAFGANSDPSGIRAGGARTPVFAMFAERAAKEYAALSPNPGEWRVLVSGLMDMWRSQPDFTPRQLAAIGLPVTIADGQHDEVIKREHTEHLAHTIPAARLCIQPGVSHFAMLQKPAAFSDELKSFLSASP